MSIESLYNEYKTQIKAQVPLLGEIIEEYLLDPISEGEFKTEIETELNAFIAYEKKTNEHRTHQSIQSYEAHQGSNQLTNVSTSEMGSEQQIEQSEIHNGTIRYVQPSEQVGTIEPFGEYEINTTRSAQIQPIDVHLGTAYSDASSVQLQYNEPSNVANYEKTDMVGTRTVAASISSDEYTNIQELKRTMERDLSKEEYQNQLEALKCNTKEKVQALIFIRENYSFPLDVKEGGSGYNPLSAHFVELYGRSKSYWTSFIKDIEFIDQIIVNVYGK